jgi:hypothetical protein
MASTNQTHPISILDNMNIVKIDIDIKEYVLVFSNDTSQATSNIEGDVMWGEVFSLLKINLANLNFCN